MARLGAKVSRSEVSLILKNTFSVGICWWNRPLTSFLGQIGYMVHSEAKFFRTKTLLNFVSKAPSDSFFQKTRFRFEFLYKIAPHLFSWPNGLDATIVGKSVPQRSFVHHKKPAPYLFSWPNWLYGAFGGKSVPEWSFVNPKKYVLGWNLLMKPAPYLFSRPNWLYGAFGGKILPDENFAQFYLKSPREFVFPKITISVWIFVLNHTSPIFLA